MPFAPDEYEAEYPMAERMRRLKHFDAEARAPLAHVLRGVMTRIGYWRDCPRKACKRARRCAMPKVDCAWARLPYLQRHLLPALDAAVAEMLAREGACERATAQNIAESRTIRPKPAVL